MGLILDVMHRASIASYMNQS